MDRKEYDAWIEETNKSKFSWQMDQVAWNNRTEMLFYCGGADGQLTMGRYEGAIPHIGEAMFKIEGRKNYIDQEDAFERLCNFGGMGILRAFFNI